MPESLGQFKPGTLWPALVERSRTALQCGALRPIQTEVHTVENAGVRFQVHVVSTLVRKQADGLDTYATAGARPNPFLPYEEALFVANVSDTHFCLLNKYNVIDQHALIITREFEPQESALTLDDFDALWRCMTEYNSLAFYNCGRQAGASQPHKHLQLVPLPFGEAAAEYAYPMEALIETSGNQPTDTLVQISQLPFRHALIRLQSPTASLSVAARAAYLHASYKMLLESLDFDTTREIAPYNLLVSRRFMLAIPRAVEGFQKVSVNALGFAGSFFGPSKHYLQIIANVGPMALLRHVGFPP